MSDIRMDEDLAAGIGKQWTQAEAIAAQAVRYSESTLAEVRELKKKVKELEQQLSKTDLPGLNIIPIRKPQSGHPTPEQNYLNVTEHGFVGPSSP